MSHPSVDDRQWGVMVLNPMWWLGRIVFGPQNATPPIVQIGAGWNQPVVADLTVLAAGKAHRNTAFQRDGLT